MTNPLLRVWKTKWGFAHFKLDRIMEVGHLQLSIDIQLDKNI